MSQAPLATTSNFNGSFRWRDFDRGDQPSPASPRDSDTGASEVASCSETVADVIKEAQLKGICKSSNAKVFLQDWTELEEGIFEEVVAQLPLEQRVFIVAEIVPHAVPDVTGSSRSSAAADCGPPNDVAIHISPQKLPEDLQHALSSAVSPLPPKHRRELVRCVVEQMMAVSPRPKREMIRSVAERMVQAYPTALEDRSISGCLLGRGYDSFFQQLEARVENIHRGKQQVSSPNPVSAQDRARLSYGCMNWQPQAASQIEDADEKKTFLQREARKTLRDMDLSLAMQYMDDTYGAQRQFINSRSPVHHASEIKKEWPLLFHHPFFYKHIEKLLGRNAKENFQSSLLHYAPLLFERLKGVLKRDVMSWIIHTEQQLSKGCEDAKEITFVPLLAAHFGDKEDILFKVFEDGTSLSNVSSELPPTPIIVALGSIFSGQCFVACEQEFFYEATDFTEAVCIMFLAYYVFNIMYPSRAATTLEFLQRMDSLWKQSSHLSEAGYPLHVRVSVAEGLIKKYRHAAVSTLMLLGKG
ncbi:hypothetical protein HPB50_019690 [Hyalomma asiaticum]|uniref:Uncharacterized protein n=1 Tax=Hyalomma asiaticum TaxID=266040 RepID=A0ACB7S6K0_HYAAI|nr:hypothetical protein HPB50_019690 [Hyalomma asiaticum]